MGAIPLPQVALSSSYQGASLAALWEGNSTGGLS
jgi:hypothetical protein